MGMTITEEMQAIMSGKQSCSAHKRGVCVTYCERRIAAMQKLMGDDGPKSIIAARLPGMQAKINFYSEFIAWAGKQNGGVQ